MESLIIMVHNFGNKTKNKEVCIKIVITCYLKGGTCLINSVQSAPLCEYLLAHGANVNAQDIQLKTALHYAIQEHRFDTTKLLVRFDACSFYYFMNTF